jgi:hypothetical protein
MGANRARVLLKRTAVELLAARELVQEKKKKLRKAENALVAANTSRELEIVVLALRSIKEHRELLKRQLAARDGQTATPDTSKDS